MARRKEPEEQPKPPARFTRREVTFYPEPWTPELDDELFATVSASFESLGVGYGEITAFAAKHQMMLQPVQNRWLLLAVRA
jgi:hypothetical protein